MEMDWRPSSSSRGSTNNHSMNSESSSVCSDIRERFVAYHFVREIRAHHSVVSARSLSVPSILDIYSNMYP